ncbi:hypothetical protein GCM10009675_40910 [Prauserella alba]|uniref:Exonuclease domain-containing protein n=2 Tax=Prauserella alba TaxID=176898 RepID=A0ABN1VP00_9PSEU
MDVETTGVDPRRSRLVSAAVVMIAPTAPGRGREVKTWQWLADPEVEIPVEATAIHGISTETARRDGRPAAEVIAEVAAVLGEVWTPVVPLCVYNAAFDLTLLDAEMSRHQGRSLPLSGPVVDPLCIDRHLDPGREQRRRLSDVCGHYGVLLEGAHTSSGDALAAARLAWKMARVFPVDVGSPAPHVLHEAQAAWYRATKDAHADERDRRAAHATARGDHVAAGKLRAKAQGVRASAEAWPVLPVRTPTQSAPGRSSSPGSGRMGNSHAPWTADEDTDLRKKWLSADPVGAAATRREQIASDYGRTPGAIRSRLLKLRCDPERPGHTCDEDRATELEKAYAAEYGRV